MSRRKPYVFEDAQKRVPNVWRSLEELDADPADLAALKEREAVTGAGLLPEKAILGRRSFLGYTGATAAALSLSGCARRPVENILPYSRAPEHVVPGAPMHFASVASRRGDALGLLVTSYEGRPTKVEGNPDHPANQGALDIYGQLAVWDLYDPDRSRAPKRREGEALVDATFEEVDAAIDSLVAAQSNGGAGLRFLAASTTSPSFVRLKRDVLARLPQARFHTYSSVNESSMREGARLAFGQPLLPVPDLRAGKVVVALDSDFLGTEPGSLRTSRDFGATRRITAPGADMSRLYVIESGFSVTGAMADHRRRVASRDIGRFLLALCKTMVGRGGFSLGGLDAAVQGASTDGFDEAFLGALADDILGNRGRSPILVGSRQPAAVHALAHALNHALGNDRRSIKLFPVTDPNEAEQLADLAALVSDIQAGRVQTLVLLGGNPVFEAPADIDLRAALGHDGLTSVHLGSHVNETSSACSWHVPLAHPLETWGDQRAADGTVSVQQPLIAPLWGGRAEIELLARFAGERNWRAHYVVRATLRRASSGAALFERDFRRALHAGVVPGTGTVPMTSLELQEAQVREALGGLSAGQPLGPDNLEVTFQPDPALFDGTHANNLWALELPDPMTKVVWDNVAVMSARTRDQLSLRNGQMIRLTRGDASIEIPVWVVPGHADWSISLNLGWGRAEAGRYGNGKGFDIRPLRTSQAFGFGDGVRVEGLGTEYDVVRTQEHGYMEGRPIAIELTADEYQENPRQPQFETVEFSNGPLWQTQDYGEGHRWGMAIDLSACSGCSACIVACQAENNIPAVGKPEVKRGREMLWMRLDRYFVGDDRDEPTIAMQPVTCQQCEEAPCENVCPVNATTHTPEGLNDMAYNRCVGTRYCANNCPYKVRRFNYLDWHHHLDHGGDELFLRTPPVTPMHGAFPETRKMQFNPNVTVRMRGVMEKCTFCVQRIQAAKIDARRDGRAIADGEIRTACQQTCPTGAITFGDLNDASSAVARLDGLDRRYKLLAEVGARPRITYLAKIRNPNPNLAPAGDDDGSQEAHG